MFDRLSGTSHCSHVSPSSLQSIEVSGWERFLRNTIRAELIAIRVSQVENFERPSKVFKWTNAFIHASCNVSSASSRLPRIRYADLNAMSECRAHNSSKAE